VDAKEKSPDAASADRACEGVNMTEEEKKIFLEWELFLRDISQFVQLAKINGIKYEVRTDEQSGHHRPHLHVSTSSASMSVAIDNGDILACSGKISPAQKKMAREWMEKNKDLVIEKWNTFSNGLKIAVS
jgi:hypothetical protein